jgi:hypothetical protein
MIRKYLDLTGLAHLITRLDDKFVAKNEASSGVFVPNIEIRTFQYGGNHCLQYRFANADAATLNSLAQMQTCTVGLMRLKKTSAYNAQTHTRTYAGKQWCMINDSTSRYDYQVAPGDIINYFNLQDNGNSVFWTNIKILPTKLPQNAANEWINFAYTKEQLAERLVYFKTLSSASGSVIQLPTLETPTASNLSTLQVKVLGELHGGKKQITASRNRNALCKFSIPLGLAAARIVDGKIYYGNIAPFMLDFSLVVIADNRGRLQLVKNIGIRLMNNTDKKI